MKGLSGGRAGSGSGTCVLVLELSLLGVMLSCRRVALERNMRAASEIGHGRNPVTPTAE